MPEVLERDPSLVRRHDIELLSASPELAAVVPNSRETLTSMAIPAERTRYYARLRTRRIANGLVEFLLGALPPGRRTVIVENADQADPTDLEFLAAALRRADPAGITLVVCSARAELADGTLLAALADHAETVQGQSPAAAAVRPPRKGPPRTGLAMMARRPADPGLPGLTSRPRARWMTRC